jgi:glycopeptide antibiotics resistance protein
MAWRRYLLSVLAALYFGALVGLAFVPGSAANRSFWFWPFAAFVPVGILLLLLLGRRRWWAAMAFGVLGSAWIEAAQSVWMPVGYAETWDVVWSAAGGVAGVLFAYLLTPPRRRPVTRTADSGPGYSPTSPAISPSKSMHTHGSPRIVSQAGNREIPQD